MLKLLLLLIWALLASMQPHAKPHLIIFTSGGSYYKLMPDSKQVQWHRSLGSTLLSFEMGSQKTDNLPSSYILPTLDGHFLYIDAQSQILIKREEVEQLLNVCLDSNNHLSQTAEPVEYFIYEKFQYYIINLKNGAAEDIETFLKKGIPPKMDYMTVLKNTKKYLKQLKTDLTVAWSTISSELELIPAPLFLQDPKTISLKQPEKSKLQFRRVGNTEVEMIGETDEIFQLGGKDHILSIFQFISPSEGYLKHPLKYYHRPKLALDYLPNQPGSTVKDIIQSDRLKSHNTVFIHSEQLGSKRKTQAQCSPLEQCINIFRTFQAISDQSNKIYPNQPFTFQKISHSDNNSLSFQTYQTSSEPIVINYGPTQSQPYLWLALIAMILVLAYVLYRMKINTLLNQISVIESKTGQKLQQFQKKLGQIEQLKKMYEVYWDKVIYQVAGDQWYEHVVFQGKFLNQPSAVYAVRLEGTDVVSLEYKLNTLLNFSHLGLCKLYYYTKNSEFLLIFTEKIEPINLKKMPEHFQAAVSASMKKSVITQMISAVAYLDSKIEINCLPHEAVSLEIRSATDTQSYYEFKLNAVPCLLKRSQDDSDFDESRSGSADSSTYELRWNLVGIFNLIIHSGQPLIKATLDEKLKNQAYSQDQYLQFFDFVLYQAKSKVDKDIEGATTNESSRQIMFRDILDHPYLWDSKRKILFLSDFSNYIETHIDDSKVKKLQSHAKDYNVIKTPWIKQFHFTFVREISNYRKYDYESVRDLIRVIRNKLNHFHEIPKDVKSNIGKTPEGFIEYCLELFPKLLHFAFVYTRKKKWKLHMK